MISPDFIFYAIILIFGASVGSFLGVIVDRLMTEEGLGGRSHCHFCKKPLKVQNLIPVVSYLMQRGRSSCCKKKLPLQYVLIEAATGVSFLAIWLTYFPSVTQIASLWIIAAALIVITFADLKFHIIPDYATIALVVVGTFSALYGGGLLPFLFAGVVLYGLMYSLYAVTKGKGMGFGDVKFAFAMGMLLGLQDGLVALYIAFLLGGVIGGLLLLSKRKGLKSAIPFGPFLVAGTVLMLFFGAEVWEVVQRVLAVL